MGFAVVCVWCGCVWGWSLVRVSDGACLGLGLSLAVRDGVGGARTDGGMVAGRGSVVRDGGLGFWREAGVGEVLFGDLVF